MSETSIRSELPVDETEQSFEISSEDTPLLEEVQGCAEELDFYRRELGRLFQVLNNLRDRADISERKLKDKREELIGKYNTGDGKWAIDFGNQRIVKVKDSAPNPV
jgi:hypothetical protein